MPDPVWGEVGCAFVVAREPVAAEALLAHLRARLAKYKVPKKVLFVDSLPLSPAGKILRRDLALRVRENG
jgi:fatty-acyl-CoA synthase